MGTEKLSEVLWAAGFIETCGLAYVLFAKGRWRSFPIFSALIVFNVVRTAVLFALYRPETAHVYRNVYWSAGVLDVALQIALVFEMARIVLKPTGNWVNDARKSFILWAGLGGFIAIGLAFAINPEAPTNLIGWVTKGRLFATLLMCEMFASMTFSASRLGLVWRNHVMALSQGWMPWALIALCTDIMHSYYGEASLVGGLETARVIAYQAATIYWAINFWIPEPESRTLSPDMQIYLEALHRRVSVDMRNSSHSDSLS